MIEMDRNGKLVESKKKKKKNSGREKKWGIQSRRSKTRSGGM